MAYTYVFYMLNVNVLFHAYISKRSTKAPIDLCKISLGYYTHVQCVFYLTGKITFC